MFVSVLSCIELIETPRTQIGRFCGNQAFSDTHARTTFTAFASALSFLLLFWSDAFVLAISRIQRGRPSASLPLIAFPLKEQKSEKAYPHQILLYFCLLGLKFVAFEGPAPHLSCQTRC